VVLGSRRVLVRGRRDGMSAPAGHVAIADVLAAVRTDPEIREAIRFAAAAERHIE
jgi:hypothetical protein